MVISGAIADGDVPALCSQVARLLDGPGALVCDVHGIEPADVAAVGGLARMQLTALRRGHRIRFDRAPSELRELIALVGLSDVLLSARAASRAGRTTETGWPYRERR
jgi:ABC-type transporter Mla MlaB component